MNQNVKDLAKAFLLALHSQHVGAFGEYKLQVNASSSKPLNVEGVNVNVVSSKFGDGRRIFAPFTLTTDSGQDMLVERAGSFRLAPFRKLTVKNADTEALGIEVTLYAGAGEYQRDGVSAPEIEAINSVLMRGGGALVYAAGKVVGPSPLPLFRNVASGLGGRGRIVKARIDKSTATVAAAAFRLYLFAQGPAPLVQLDNSNWNVPVLGNVDKVPIFAGVIDFPVFESESGGGGSYCEVVASVPFACSNSSQDLYGVLVARDAYATGANEQFSVWLWSERYPA